MLPSVTRQSLRSLRGRFAAGGTADHRGAGIQADVSHSRCFPIPNGSPVSGIRLNLVGREPQGVLRPGPETDAFCEQLARDLLAIIDERTGGPLITAVDRTDTLYRGAHRNALPDLLVEWSDRVATGTLAHAEGRGATVRATSEKINVVEGCNRYSRTGEHVSTGMFVCAGPGVSVAARNEPVSVMDFHPTICRLLGLAAPSGDGDIIPELASC
jgi:predicted AlkP superfamily phosphohydrolase/phosphomutase